MADQALRATRPDHVPADLFWDHHLVEYCAELEDAFVSGARLHDGPDIIYARDLGYGEQGWVVTRYSLQEEIFLDPARFSSEGLMDFREMLGVSWVTMPICLDPPAHTRYRQARPESVRPAVQPGAQNDNLIRTRREALLEHRVDVASAHVHGLREAASDAEARPRALGVHTQCVQHDLRLGIAEDVPFFRTEKAFRERVAVADRRVRVPGADRAVCRHFERR